MPAKTLPLLSCDLCLRAIEESVEFIKECPNCRAGICENCWDSHWIKNYIGKIRFMKSSQEDE